MSRRGININSLGHPFSRINLVDQWEVDRDPVLTSTTSAKIEKTAKYHGQICGVHAQERGRQWGLRRLPQTPRDRRPCVITCAAGTALCGAHRQPVRGDRRWRADEGAGPASARAGRSCAARARATPRHDARHARAGRVPPTYGAAPRPPAGRRRPAARVPRSRPTPRAAPPPASPVRGVAGRRARHAGRGGAPPHAARARAPPRRRGVPRPPPRRRRARVARGGRRLWG